MFAYQSEVLGTSASPLPGNSLTGFTHPSPHSQPAGHTSGRETWAHGHSMMWSLAPKRGLEVVPDIGKDPDDGQD